MESRSSTFFRLFPQFLREQPYTRPIEGGNVEIIEWKKMKKKIMDELKKEPQLMEKFEDMRKSESGNWPLLGCLLSNDAFKRMIGEYVAQCKQQIEVDTAGRKNATKAASIRLQGNQLFVKKEYRLAFKMYTRGLMFTKDEDEETPLLYANRSAVYFHLKQYENALEDIERAFKFGYGKIKPIEKLLIRKGFSLLALGRDVEVKELLDANMPASDNDPDFAQWQQLKKQSENVNRQSTKRDITMSQFQEVSTVRAALFNNDVFRPHERFPWLNAKIDLRYDAEKGYHLVSKEELKYGEIVAISKPCVSLDPKRNSYERCHYCMVPCFEFPKYFSGDKAKISSDSLRMVTPLACPECSNVLYCSEACRTAAWTAYHRFECSQMAILAKMASKVHLALRMLYMMGSLEGNSPIEQMIRECQTTADPCALMIDQQAYSFVYSNPLSQSGTLERCDPLHLVKKYIKNGLTVCFLLKLAQMGNRLAITSSNLDKESLKEATFACLILFRLLAQVKVNESVQYLDRISFPELESTLLPYPFLSVDGMTALMKHSCEATVATSSLLRESLSSNVKLLYATGAIPVGTQLTLAYDTEGMHNFESLPYRKLQLRLRYTFNCACSRCLRESRDSLDPSTGVYYPIVCSICGELMVRDNGEDSWRCSATDGCNFKYSAQQMKNVYERIGKMMQLERELSFAHSPFLHSSSDDELLQQPYSTVQPKIAQLKVAIESTVHLLYGSSEFLARLYGNLAQCYLLISMAPISNNNSGSVLYHFTPTTHRIHTTHLTTALLYTDKALDVLESMAKGPCAKSKISSLMEQLLRTIILAVSYFFLQNEPLFDKLRSQMEQAKCRYEALLKSTAYDTMVVSSLPATTQEMKLREHTLLGFQRK